MLFIQGTLLHQSEGEMLLSKGEVLQLSGRTDTNQGRTVTMEARAKCEKGEALLIHPYDL